MTLININQIRKSILTEEFDYTVLTAVLSGYSGVRQKINDLLKSGEIIRVKKGLYVFGESYTQTYACRETLANLIYGPSYISLEYALSFYGLIPERVESITSVTPKRDKEFLTPLGRFTYRYLNIKKYSQGIEQVMIDSQHPVLMASPEKALCDYMMLQEIPDFTGAQDARVFLEDDLRIDRAHWKKFNSEQIRKMNKIFNNKNIDYIQEVL